MDNSALLTDLYQITMAHAYWRERRDNDDAVFHLFFRKPPFGGGYAIAAGLEPVRDWLEAFHFKPDDIQFLRTLVGNDGEPLFVANFLDHLAALQLTVDIDAVPEGTVVFPHQPLVRVRGPLLQCQLLETALLCLVNFNTLIATKAARICHAAGNDPVLEFGLRRAQGADGAVAASRAAHLGGCTATSNVLAAKTYGIPVRGTHAHSWVMSYPDEPAAFAAYAKAMPNNGVFLVDTYDTLEGVRHACDAGRALRAAGKEMIGIRLDSGDLAWLSIEARKILDEGGFPKAVIVASNDLDERLITSLKDQGARIDVWGVGTKLVTAYDQPALGGVYKLSAVRTGGVWRDCVKLSEQAIKVSNPGIQQVRRYKLGNEFIGDMIWDEQHSLPGQRLMVDPADPTRRKKLPPEATHEDLLIPIMRSGQAVAPRQTLAEARARVKTQLAGFHSGIKRFDNPHTYPVGLEAGLHERKTALVMAARVRAGKD
jgi:nicotinate phosphoribosyltransferase